MRFAIATIDCRANGWKFESSTTIWRSGLPGYITLDIIDAHFFRDSHW
jgi:hypothetical protein